MQAIEKVVAWTRAYERQISALSLAGGFAFDSYTFGRIDHPITQAVFVIYLLIAGIAIAILHILESRPDGRKPAPRTKTILVAIAQFALGCLLSGFCVFYIRSASITSSWPFLLAMAAIFIGNEYMRRYHSQLVFAALLYFFAIYSYAIFLVPILVGGIGRIQFLLSGFLAVLFFFFYMQTLARLGNDRYRDARMQILIGMVLITIFINAAYFLRILPPLPLVLTEAGVYHDVKRVKGGYLVSSESEPAEWRELFGVYPVMHIQPRSKLYVFNAVFAPRGLHTRIVHDWEWLDPRIKGWVSEQRISEPIIGGRQNGYRYFTDKTAPRPGQWLVKIQTFDGRAIGRVRFTVEDQAVPPATTTHLLK